MAGSCVIAAHPNGSFSCYLLFSVGMAMSGCLLTSLPTMVANLAGREAFPVINSIQLTAGGLVSATTSVIAGIIADRNGGDYANALYLYAVVAVVACLVAVFGVGIPSIHMYKKEQAGNKITNEENSVKI